jgi:hypothetical protein
MTLIVDTDITSKPSENSISNVNEINKTKLNVNSIVKTLNLAKDSSNTENDKNNGKNKHYCLICGQLFFCETKNIDKKNNEDECKNAFLFHDRICYRCRGPFQNKKEKLEKLSIPILVSLLLQASLKHLDVNNMVNQALYSKQDSLKSAILSNITAPLILSPHSSQLLIINDKDSIVISSKKNDDSKNTISNMLHRKVIESNQQLLNFGAIQRQAIQLTPSGRKPRTGPLGSYEDMIVQALISIGDINGSKPKDIFDWMEQHCLGIPEAFRASASQALKKAVEKEKVQRIGNGLYKMNKKYELEILSKKEKQNSKSNANLPNHNLSESSSTNSNDTKSLSKNNEKSKKNAIKEKNKENIDSGNIYIKKETSKLSKSDTSSSNKYDTSYAKKLLKHPYKKRKITKEDDVPNNIKSLNDTSQSIDEIITSSLSSPMDLISNTINSNKLSENTPLTMDQTLSKAFPDIISSDVYNNITNETNFVESSNSSVSPFSNESTLTSPNQNIYNSSYTLSSKKKEEMNLLSKYTNALSNDITNINIESLNFNDDKDKAIYDQLIQQDPSTISSDVVGDSTGGLNLLSSELFPTSVGDENLNQESTGTNNIPLFYDPRLQYLINPTSNTISPSIIDFLNQSNTINPVTHSLSPFNNSPSTSSRSNSLNYSLYNNMLWSNQRS